MALCDDVSRISNLVNEVELLAEESDWIAVSESLNKLSLLFHDFFEKDIAGSSIDDQVFAKQKLQPLYQRIEGIYALAESQRKDLVSEGKKLSVGLKMSNAYARGRGG